MNFFQYLLPWLILGAVASNASLLAFFFRQFHKKDKVIKLFIIASTIVFLWTVVNFFNVITHHIIFARLAYATGIWIFPLFFIWALHFIHEEKVSLWKIFPLSIPALILSISAFIGGLLIEMVTTNPMIGSVPVFGPVFPYVIALTFISYGAVLFTLIRGYIQSGDTTKRSQLFIIIIGFILFGTILLTANFVLPFLGYIYLIDFDVPSSVFLVGSIVYAISKYKLFNTKLLFVNVAVVILWVILTAQIAIGSPNEQVIHIITLILSILFGILLIKSVNKEIAQRERLEQLTIRLRDFVSFASHELRGPVSKFKSVISMIFEGDFGEIPPGIRDILQDTYIEAEDMGQTIDMFLNLNRIETNAFALNVSQNDIVSLIYGLVEQARYHANKKNITIRISTTNTIPEVSFDFFAMQHVIKNVLSNAIKYNVENGTITITITARQDVVEVTCTDTGIGLHEEALSHVFTKYQRSRESLSQKIEGHGIGMWLSKKILEFHGGTIWVESEGLGKGSTFIFRLPLSKK